MESIDTRKKILTQWLRKNGLRSFSLQSLISQASFRRYFRVRTQHESFIAMDAPPEQENCAPYIAIANALGGLGLEVPKILASNLSQGFLLISDLGDLTYLSTLNAQNVNSLYIRALNALAILQSCSHVPNWTVPTFTQTFMWQEWTWHKEWFLRKFLNLSLDSFEKDLDQCMKIIIETAANQPQVFMHRDYHSGNLMVLAKDNQVGILDFQDAFFGPVTYDAVSLLRDAYIAWPEVHVIAWATTYWQLLRDRNVISVSCEEFLQWFDWMGLQRHLKAIFTFTRKHLRDHQSHYLKHVHRTLGYLLNVSEKYSQFVALHHYLKEVIKPSFERVDLCEG